MILDYFNIILNDLKHKRLRSWLTIIGIIISIASIVSLISLAQGFKAGVNKQFENMGSDKITIAPKMFVGSSPLTKIDLEKVKQVNGVKSASGIIYKIAPLTFSNQRKYAYLTGLPLDKESKELFESMKSFKIVEGRDLKPGDKYKILLGSYAADGLFSKRIKVGDSVTLLGKKFRVVGIVGSFGDREDDSAVYVPVTIARNLLNEPNAEDLIFVQVDKGSEPEVVAKSIEKKLDNLYGVTDKTEPFLVLTNEDLSKRINDLLIVVQVIFLGIAFISILVGGVGITTTMYTSVVEKTKEIGIMKAVGARNSDILAIFLAESSLISLIGGIIGLGIGVVLAKLVQIISVRAMATSLIQVYLTWQLLLGVLVFSLFIGLLSGLSPAIKASKMTPVKALRFSM